jgi:hypothetical protein
LVEVGLHGAPALRIVTEKGKKYDLLWLMEAGQNGPAAKAVVGLVDLALSPLKMEGQDVADRVLNIAEKKIAQL